MSSWLDSSSVESQSGNGRSLRTFVGVLSVVVALGVVAFAITRVPEQRGSLSDSVTVSLTSLVFVGAALLAALRAWSRPGERIGWALFAVGLACYAAATVYSALKSDEFGLLPFPSIADLGWLLIHPFLYAGMVALVIRQVGRRARLWLDSAIVGLGVAAVLGVIVMENLLVDFPTFRLVETVTKFAYPALDVVLLGMLGWLMAMTGASHWRRLTALAASMAVFAVGDIVYLALISRGHYYPGHAIDIAVVAGLAGIGLSAWWGGSTVVVRDDPRVPIFIPAVCAVGALVVFVAGTTADLFPVPVILAAATLAFVAIRTVVSLRLRAEPAEAEGLVASPRTGPTST